MNCIGLVVWGCWLLYKVKGKPARSARADTETHTHRDTHKDTHTHTLTQTHTQTSFAGGPLTCSSPFLLALLPQTWQVKASSLSRTQEMSCTMDFRSCCQSDMDPAVETIQALDTDIREELPAEPEEPELPELPRVASPWSFSRRCAVSEGIIRGIPLQATLRGAGHLWRKPPCDMSTAEKVRVWNMTQDVKKFDVFFSHSWATSGRLKYAALLIDTGFGYSVLFWIAAELLAASLYLFDFLPMPHLLHVEIAQFSGDFPLGMWMMAFGALAQFIGLILSPYLPSKRRDCFVDFASINQFEPELMHRGILGLGDCLSLSTELCILWSPKVFTRLWCLGRSLCSLVRGPPSPLQKRKVPGKPSCWKKWGTNKSCENIHNC